MNKFLKIISVVTVLTLAVFFVCACSSNKDIPSDGYSSDEIASKYDDIADGTLSDKPIDSSASVLGFGFSTVDFTFTSADDTVAFSLDKNTFVKIALGGTFYNYIKPGSELSSFEAGYKTARGISLASNSREILAKYGIGDENAVYKKQGDTFYYKPTAGIFSGKLTALYASKDSQSYEILKASDVQKFISLRPSDSAYMNPEDIMSKFSAYSSLVSIDITADEAGGVSELCFYKFDK